MKRTLEAIAIAVAAVALLAGAIALGWRLAAPDHGKKSVAAEVQTELPAVPSVESAAVPSPVQARIEPSPKPSTEVIAAQEAVQMPSPAASTVPLADADSKQITLTFAGDCTMGIDESFDYEGSFNEVFAQKGPAYFFQNVKDVFSGDDLTVVNFEGTLTQSETREDKTYAFKGDAAFAEALPAGDIELANLANNHSKDYGEASFIDTKRALEDVGVETFAYDDVLVKKINGVKVGFFGQFTVYSGEPHREDMEKNIQKLKDMGAELIVANFHWGMEGYDFPENDQIQLAHDAIDAGAHLVIGTHPHVLEGIERYKGRYIVYCLGNFCFGGNYHPTDCDCMIFQQTFTVENGQVAEDQEIQIIPCSISSVRSCNDYCPTPAEGEERERIFEKLRIRSEGLGEGNPVEEYLERHSS